MVTFGVDEVSPASEALPTRPLRERFPDALTIGGDPATPIVDHGAMHPLLGAVGLAFAQHRPLVLSPDAVWLTIAQGVAEHIRLHAETLRHRLVRHDGRKRLEVTWDGAMPEDAASWTALVAALRGELAAQIGDGRARLFECDFSTSTDVERVASQVVLLDAHAPYFSYWMWAGCGIPAITLTGTPADWRRIRERVDVIAELGLERWCRSLVPIADQLVRAAAGDADDDRGPAAVGDPVARQVTRGDPRRGARDGRGDRPPGDRAPRAAHAMRRGRRGRRGRRRRWCVSRHARTDMRA